MVQDTPEGVFVNPLEVDFLPDGWPPFRSSSIMHHERNIRALNEWLSCETTTKQDLLDLHCQTDILYMETGIWVDVYDFYGLREEGGDYFWMDEINGGLNEEWQKYANEYGGHVI